MAALEAKFAANLKAARTKRHLSQGDVAYRAGISVSYVSMLERGLRSPPLGTIEAVAKALRMTPGALLE